MKVIQNAHSDNQRNDSSILLPTLSDLNHLTSTFAIDRLPGKEKLCESAKILDSMSPAKEKQVEKGDFIESS